MRRIDVHHHFFPADLNRLDRYKTLGWRAPPGNNVWSPEVSLRLMDAAGIDIALLSLPPIVTGKVGRANRALARDRNIALARLRQDHPNRFGFFATLPVLDDVEGALAEIAYALDELHADGVSIPSCYGTDADSTYIGDDRYDAVWAELNRRCAVVFIHGAQVPSSTPYPHEYLGIPISEVPNETYKAAAHLVVTGRKRKYCNVKIILGHMGGSTVFLAPRVAVLSNHMGCPLSPDEIMEDFKTFYYDTALSAHETTLTAMDAFIDPDHLLFGSDIPGLEMAAWYSKNLEEHYADNATKLEEVLRTNALKLFPNLGKYQYDA